MNDTRVPVTVNRRIACLALLSSGVQATEPSRTFEIGVLPNISARVLMGQYQPMREYLARELGLPVQVSTAPNWQTFHQRTLDQAHDLVITAAHLARLAQLDRGHVPLATYQPAMKGLLACAIARPVQRIADLSGQTLVLSNPQSLVTLRGMQWMAAQGLQRDRDFKTVNTPTDDSVGNVVLRGEASAAMLSGGEFRAMPESVRAQLQIMTTFAEVPGFVVLAHPRLPAAQMQRLQALLLRFPATDDGRQFSERTGFTGMAEPAAGLMESMDAYVATTRKLIAPAG